MAWDQISLSLLNMIVLDMAPRARSVGAVNTFMAWVVAPDDARPVGAGDVEVLCRRNVEQGRRRSEQTLRRSIRPRTVCSQHTLWPTLHQGDPEASNPSS